MPGAVHLLSACTLTAVFLSASPANGQDAPEPPPYKSHRFDEDYSYLTDPPRRIDVWDGLKYQPIPGVPGGFISFGGEARERFESVRNPDFGLDLRRDRVFLHRFMLHTDVYLGPSVRAFAQVGSFHQSGRLSEPAPTDVDRLDLTQGFVDLSFATGDMGRATLRGGRQEMSFGSSRLVSVRESPNVRRAFDGGRAFWTGGDYRVDGFFVRPITLASGAFDDRTDASVGFWGLYGTGPVPGIAGLKADLYYFGYDRDEAEFAAGTARERRHTLGTRLFGATGGWDWDVEGALQFGTFGSQSISAWTVASDIGFTFGNLPLAPRLGLKADVASGDGNLADRTLGTFNPLFPKLPYFSEAGLVAPANVTDLQPNLALKLSDTVEATLGYNVLWRHRRGDAFYAPPLQPVAGTEDGGSRYIGAQALAGIEWQATRQLTLAAGYVHFFAGDTVRRVGGRDVDFFTASAQFKF